MSGKLHSQCTAVIGANISPIEGCEILTIQFNDLSTGPVLSRIWDLEMVPQRQLLPVLFIVFLLVF